MADIDQIIAGGAGASSRVDFAKLADLPSYYWKGRDEYAKSELRDSFRDGLPRTADGQPDFGAISQTFFKNGDMASGLAATKLGLEQQKLKYGMEAGASDFPSATPPSAAAPPATPPITSPPSANRSASVLVAAPLNRGGATAGAPRGDQPGSIVGLVSGAGVPDELAGPIIAQVSAITKTDPNAAVNPQNAQRVAQIVQEVVRRNGMGSQPPAAAAPQSAPVAAPAPAAPPVDPTLGGLVPNGRTPQQQIDILSRRVASGLLTPEQAKVYETRIKAIQDALQPTQDMKNAAASGKSLEDYQNRSDEQATQREILSKSLLPKLDKSQDAATAARDDIDSIHRAREELDKGAGVFSGSFADKRLQLAKLASFLGVQNADKIANTEAYAAAVGQRVAAMVKAFGSGTAISDGDRRFASEMAGGRITLDEKSMRRILDIGERAARGKIDNHNKLVDNTMNANEALKPARDTYIVTAPGAYKKAESESGPSAIGSKADYDKLPSGSVFTGPDGKQWRKP
jgi:hypothetical protein